MSKSRLITNKPVKIYLFTSPDCAPCHVVSPHVERFVQRNKLLYEQYNVYTQEGAEKAAGWNISAIPTMVVDDGKSLSFHSGTTGILKQLEEMMVAYLYTW